MTSAVEAHVEVALTLSADPSWAVRNQEAVVTWSRQQVRRLLRELDQLGGQLQRPEPKSLSAALTNLAKMHETCTTLALWDQRHPREASHSEGIAGVEAVQRGREWLA